MSTEPAENLQKIIQQLGDEVEDLYKFRDFFFENHPLEMAGEKNKMLIDKVAIISEKFNLLEESDVPLNLRAQYLYIKGRCFNVVMKYDPRALECFSKAVKLNPNLIEAWNELGESYWKNLNVKESQACLEGSLQRKRHHVTLRSLSIVLRQQCDGKNRKETSDNILRSVEYAKEAVTMDPKDGVSWSVLGNAYLCQFFMVAQQPNTLKLAMSAYKQAWNDAIARGTPDLQYNKGITAKYEEDYEEAMECFEMACKLDPSWPPPVKMIKQMADYLQYVDDMVHNKGRIKIKRLQQMVKSMDIKLCGEYAPGQLCTFNQRTALMERIMIEDMQDGTNEGKVVLGRVVGSFHSENTVPFPERLTDRQCTFNLWFNQRTALMERIMIEDMQDGTNEGKVVLGRVVGSFHSENTVPFTFAMVDESMACVAVNVYNWADGRGVIIGDCVCIPEPAASTHVQKTKFPDTIEKSEFVKETKSKKDKMYNFRSIRINNPMQLLINGKRVGRNQFACTRVTTTLEAC